MNVQQEIARRVRRAIDASFPEASGAPDLVAPAQNEQFGDYQANCAMQLASRLGRKPRDVAGTLAEAIDRGDMLAEPQIAGPGFVNFRLERMFMEDRLRAAAEDDRVGVPAAEHPRTIVVDFSSPNTCKPMHVGHIRSTVIGDAIRRLLRFLGHHVVADNHLGDWGTQFGLLIAGFRRFGNEVPETTDPLERLVAVYKRAGETAEADEAFREEARRELGKLQAGDEENLAKWRTFNQWSWEHFKTVYERLDVHFDEVLGESFYNDRLAAVVEELREKGIARESEGAVCIFWEDDRLSPMLVQKRDGAFLYATTDLATLKYREERWKPGEIVYVTDARQQLHFQQLFSAADRWGVARGTELKHVWFGTILGPDGRPFKTRSGELVPLQHVLDEAENRALAIVREKNSTLSDERMREIARVVGLGAIKYADLSQNRQSDFVFDWDRMLAMQGNTAPYLQYAYARIRSIFRKGRDEAGNLNGASPTLTEPAERALGLKLLRFPETIAAAENDYRLNLICTYLYELSSVFTTFYESCPVLRSAPAVRAGRLALCDLTATVLRTGLGLLGIQVTERM